MSEVSEIDAICEILKTDATQAQSEALNEVVCNAQNEAYAEGRADQREDDMRLLNWAYSKLQHMHFTKQEDALALDEIKMMQMGAA